jgi:2-aminobenzoate-CoA ligase
VLLEQGAPQDLVDAVLKYKATILFTAPTSYRAIAAIAEPLRGGTLRKCVSAGEACRRRRARCGRRRPASR